MLHNAQLYLKLKLGDPARAYFQRVLDDYPETPQAGEARVGIALADAVAGKKPQAIARLKELEAQFPGQPIAVRAAKERERLEK